MWKDALAKARSESALWPYQWVNGVDYPHENERATVRAMAKASGSAVVPLTGSKTILGIADLRSFSVPAILLQTLAFANAGPLHGHRPMGSRRRRFAVPLRRDPA